MATLPTFDIQDPAIINRIMAAFTGEIDDLTGATLTPVQAYKAWLKRVLIEKVQQSEASKDNSLTSGLT